MTPACSSRPSRRHVSAGDYVGNTLRQRSLLMLTSTRFEPLTFLQTGKTKEVRVDGELVERYHSLLAGRPLTWTTHHRLQRRLGSGGQGVVYLTERRGADDFTLPIALKIFSPEPFTSDEQYEAAMGRMARVACHVAQIQHDSLVSVHNFVDRARVRMMVMEWVDGYDLRQLMTPGMLLRIHNRVEAERWRYINDVLVTSGPAHPRLKPGVAVAIVRDCLGALAALHREGIVHGDIKPSNIMLKRSGAAKLIDIGSAFELMEPPEENMCTPTYAAPEVLENRESSARSDLASLGYVLIEMLAGQPPFEAGLKYRQLLDAKRALPSRLDQLLPKEVTVNALLMNLCRRLIAPDPAQRFPTAEMADFHQGGAAAFQRQLILGDMAAEYGNEIRLWIEQLREMDESERLEADGSTQ